LHYGTALQKKKKKRAKKGHEHINNNKNKLTNDAKMRLATHVNSWQGNPKTIQQSVYKFMSPSSQTNRDSHSQEIPCLLLNPKFHYRIHNRPTHNAICLSKKQFPEKDEF
jgi:hypothetical protein